MSDKSAIIRAFNKHFFEFIDDVISINPENTVMKSARESFETIRKANPTSIVKVWYTYVYSTYSEQIEKLDIDFFINKDYSVDLTPGTVNNTNRVLSMIESIRDPIRSMSVENKAHCAKYISNLTKLSVAYSAISPI